MEQGREKCAVDCYETPDQGFYTVFNHLPT